MGADQIPCIIDDSGFIDGDHWYALEAVFKDWAKRHNRPRAVSTAERMAGTVDDIVPDLMMVASGIVEAEWDEALDNEGWDPAGTHFWKTFDGMCERFASGYQPKDATEFVKDLVARLVGLR